MIDRNDRISLSWQQFIWAVATIVAIIVTWQNVSNRLGNVEVIVRGAYTKADIDAMKHEADLVHADLYRRIELLDRQRKP
jgi:hypothetical protein